MKSVIDNKFEIIIKKSKFITLTYNIDSSLCAIGNNKINLS